MKMIFSKIFIRIVKCVVTQKKGLRNPLYLLCGSGTHSEADLGLCQSLGTSTGTLKPFLAGRGKQIGTGKLLPFLIFSAFFAILLDTAKWLRLETYILHRRAMALAPGAGPLCHLSEQLTNMARTRVEPHQQLVVSGTLPPPESCCRSSWRLGLLRGRITTQRRCNARPKRRKTSMNITGGFWRAS
jgi:hypothetical protein